MGCVGGKQDVHQRVGGVVLSILSGTTALYLGGTVMMLLKPRRLEVETTILDSSLFLKMTAKSLVVQHSNKGRQPLALAVCGLSLAAPLTELKYCHVIIDGSSGRTVSTFR